MPIYRVLPNGPLHGSVRLGGAKNVSFKLMIAALLGDEESRILNFSHISDVELVKNIANDLGARAYNAGERTLFIDPASMSKSAIPAEYGSGSRASTMFIPALLHRFGVAEVPLPGGDKIGARPIDRHVQALEALGAKFSQTNGVLRVEAPNGLTGATYRFDKNTHTGTETFLMAAAKARGTTILENAAEEPEVDDMIRFLNTMGAHIRRRAHRVIEIEGVEHLGGAIHSIMPDRNEAVSYAVAAIATKGDIIVENARHQHLEAFLEKLDEIGGGYEVGDYGIRFYDKGQPLRATDVKVDIHPGFMTDWQPLWAVLLTQAQGESEIHETVHASRFQYADALQEMGVKIEFYNPKVEDPEKYYNFDIAEYEKHQHAMKITGPVALKPTTYTVPDLRAGATILLAALIANGESRIVDQQSHVERGYESITDRLNSMGANIIREESIEGA